MSAPVPEVVGRYRILHKLGEGGMGSVWLAEDLTLRRQVALKVPHFPTGTDPRVLERFRREARIAAQIDHPNFCPVLDVGEDNGQPYLVMPHLKGKPLSHYIRPGEPWPLLNAVRTIANHHGPSQGSGWARQWEGTDNKRWFLEQIRSLLQKDCPVSGVSSPTMPSAFVSSASSLEPCLNTIRPC